MPWEQEEEGEEGDSQEFDIDERPEGEAGYVHI
jgi:hypothetical protein